MTTTNTTKKTNTNAVITIKFNQEKGGIELSIPDGRRLTAAERQELKELGFSWHRKNGYYYCRYTEERMAAIKKSFLKDSKFPAAKEEKKVSESAHELAEQRAAAQAAKPKKEPKKSAQAARLDALEDNMAKLTELLTQLTGQMMPQEEA